MCGRFAWYGTLAALTNALGRNISGEQPTTRYNITPGTWVSGLRQRPATEPATLEALWWGFRPHWCDDKAPQPINARAETVATSRFFRDAFADRRCLVPASGWYEWTQTDAHKQPHYITHHDSDILWFAGIWTRRADDRPGCAIITEPARGAARAIHPRMPLTLDPACLNDWLDPDIRDRDTLRQRIHRLDPEQLAQWPVSTRVNRPAVDDAELIVPLVGEAG